MEHALPRKFGRAPADLDLLFRDLKEGFVEFLESDIGHLAARFPVFWVAPKKFGL
jgi:hypothetical protein